MDSIIYHLCDKNNFDKYQATDPTTKEVFYQGSDFDTKDGFLHFSTKKYIEESCRRYLKGKPNLLMLKVDTDKLKTNSEKFKTELKWDKVSTDRADTDTFPHVYGVVPLDAIVKTFPIQWDQSLQQHIFPSDF